MTEYSNNYKEAWMETHTGKKIYPFDIRIEDIDIGDISHSLSMKCRFGGHTKEFYSIAEHCIYCSWFIDNPDLKLFALLHDAAEAYLPDLIRPIKNHVPFLVDAEKDIIVKIMEKFVGRAPNEFERKQIKEIDNIMLLTEASQLLDNLNDWELYGVSSDKIDKIGKLAKFNPKQAEFVYKFIFDSLTEKSKEGNVKSRAKRTKAK